MKFTYRLTAAACAAAVLFAPLPAAAGASEDEALRKLDIMLMVTSLRCRFGPDNFQPEYQRFSARHNAALGAAAKRLQAAYVGQLGAKGAARKLDQMSVVMANQYGQGHPWMGCRELKQMAARLATGGAEADLHLAAREALGVRPADSTRLAAR